MKQIPIILCSSGLGLAKLMTSCLADSLGNSLACVSRNAFYSKWEWFVHPVIFHILPLKYHPAKQLAEKTCVIDTLSRWYLCCQRLSRWELCKSVEIGEL